MDILTIIGISRSNPVQIVPNEPLQFLIGQHCNLLCQRLTFCPDTGSLFPYLTGMQCKGLDKLRPKPLLSYPYLLLARPPCLPCKLTSLPLHFGQLLMDILFDTGNERKDVVLIHSDPRS